MAPLNRRQLLQSTLAAGLLRAAKAQLPAPAPADNWLLLGTGSGQGIYRARWNPATGQIGAPELAIATPSPSYLALHPHLPVLYACNEGAGPQATISAFTLTRPGAQLTPLAVQPTHGDAPCFVTVDPTGTLLFTANYTGGSLSVFPLDPAGKPTPAIVIYHPRPTLGPNKDRQDAPHLHCVTLSPDGRFLLACDLGDDTILAFPLPAANPHSIGQPTHILAPTGAGPRHLAFHPNGRWLYCVNELNCTVTLYDWHPAPPAAQLRPAATFPIGTPPSTAAEIRIAPDGRFLYTSTRGADVLTVAAIDPQTGQLAQIQQLPCGGQTPRFFTLDPSTRFLLCANQNGNSLTTFTRDAGTGRLTPQATTPAPNPQCILFL